MAYAERHLQEMDLRMEGMVGRWGVALVGGRTHRAIQFERRGMHACIDDRNICQRQQRGGFEESGNIPTSWQPKVEVESMCIQSSKHGQESA